MSAPRGNSGRLEPRLAAPADAPLLLPLIRSYYAHDGLPYRAARIRRGLAELLRDPAIGRAYLFEASGRTAGYALVTWGFDIEFGGRLALLTDLYLLPEHRRRGHGLRLLRFLAGECRRDGVHALELQVERHNLPARALYRRFGFQALDRLPLSKDLDPRSGRRRSTR